MTSPVPPVRLDATVQGRVQGVGYRMFAAQRALALGLVGWVSNEPDGRVRCLVEGPRADLETYLAALQLGPLGARVDRVDAAWTAALGSFSRFEIRSGWTSGD